MEGGDLCVVPLEVNEVEEILGCLLLTFLPGRDQGVSMGQAQGAARSDPKLMEGTLGNPGRNEGKQPPGEGMHSP